MSRYLGDRTLQTVDSGAIPASIGRGISVFARAGYPPPKSRQPPEWSPYTGTVWSVEFSAGCSSDAADPDSWAPPAAAASESVSTAGAAFFALELVRGFAGDLRGVRAPRGLAAGAAPPTLRAAAPLR